MNGGSASLQSPAPGLPSTRSSVNICLPVSRPGSLECPRSRAQPSSSASCSTAEAAEGHSDLERWPRVQDNISSLGSGDVATRVTKQFTNASCPASQMALQLPCARSPKPSASQASSTGPSLKKRLGILALGLLSQERGRHAVAPL